MDRIKKYYYTDPLAAAWMAKHFGMRILEDILGETCALSIADILGHIEEPGFRYYIHPDDLHMLKVQAADIVCYIEYSQEIQGDGTPHKLIELHYYGSFSPTTELGGITYKNHVKEIIQRTGIAFMWPQSEAV